MNEEFSSVQVQVSEWIGMQKRSERGVGDEDWQNMVPLY